MYCVRASDNDFIHVEGVTRRDANSCMDHLTLLSSREDEKWPGMPVSRQAGRSGLFQDHSGFAQKPKTVLNGKVSWVS